MAKQKVDLSYENDIYNELAGAVLDWRTIDHVRTKTKRDYDIIYHDGDCIIVRAADDYKGCANYERSFITLMNAYGIEQITTNAKSTIIKL